MIHAKLVTAKNNVDLSHAAHTKAVNSGFADEAFKAVTNLIISDMNQTRIGAKQVEERLQDLMSSGSYPNFLRDLHATEKMADHVVANARLAVEQMNEAIADAEEWKVRARNVAGGRN
ncbi:unnamed protein product [Arabis nemorensis]|uniref:Uncharacterized protein n=1 Tax=Arabis nemorensis TaxID=586526 RepID=A0A565BEW6_9BRAS|nr:unnamed protein product [Arabis nemorensis]